MAWSQQGKVRADDGHGWMLPVGAEEGAAKSVRGWGTRYWLRGQRPRLQHPRLLFSASGDPVRHDPDGKPASSASFAEDFSCPARHIIAGMYFTSFRQ